MRDHLCCTVKGSSLRILFTISLINKEFVVIHINVEILPVFIGKVNSDIYSQAYVMTVGTVYVVCAVSVLQLYDH